MAPSLSREACVLHSSWRMPIRLDHYPDRSPQLSAEEIALMQEYLTDNKRLESGKVRYLLNQLSRFEGPFLDTVRLSNQTRDKVASARRLLFQSMLHTHTAFWAWPKAIWIPLMDPQAYRGIRFWMGNLAYLFCGLLLGEAANNYGLMAEVIFRKETVNAQVDKLYAPFLASGYSTDQTTRYRFRWMIAFLLLINRSPIIEAISPTTLLLANDLLAELPQRSSVRGQQKQRHPLVWVQSSLCQLGLLKEPVIGSAKPQRAYVAGWADDPSIAPHWRAWIQAYYDQTPRLTEGVKRRQCSDLASAGRWLNKHSPDVVEPQQWTEVLAYQYAAYLCTTAMCGDQSLPSYGKHAYYHQAPTKLGPSGINARLQSMRVFFSHLQRRPYTVLNHVYSKLHFAWLPSEVFKTPDDVRAALQPNPRDIHEDIWFKLIWAACTLTGEKLATIRQHSLYPVAYYRAVCLVWVTAARRSDEIRRLQLGCVQREWAPEMCDEHGHPVQPAEELCYLRVPTNKLRGEFYVPIPAYVADAIAIWERIRPQNQSAVADRKTHKPTHYLFQYRNELMGRNFLNNHAIPLLCRLAGIEQADIVGRITSHRARATTATWMRKMGMAPTDIGKLLGHTNPAKSLPWYLREDKHHLGRAYRKANPLERYVAAILDTDAHAKQEPCIFYYLADGFEGRPRMCGNPHFSRCIHQMQCIECEAFIDHEQAEAIEKREGAVLISVPIPLPPVMVAELNEQDEEGNSMTTTRESRLPPTLPGPAFHFNKQVPLRSATPTTQDLQARLASLEAQIAKRRQGKADRRSASWQALLQEQAKLQAQVERQQLES
jgi:integrase